MTEFETPPGPSDPIRVRLARRRAEIMRRVELLEAEAEGAGEWSEGASIALNALHDEMEHLLGLHYTLLAVRLKAQMERHVGALP